MIDPDEAALRIYCAAVTGLLADGVPLWRVAKSARELVNSAITYNDGPTPESNSYIDLTSDPESSLCVMLEPG
jgi:hypothetical protein